jgi:predicted transcriptional regulator
MLVDQFSRSMGDIQALFRSRLQIQILLSLADGNKTLAQLRDITGSSSQALIPRIRKLESSNFMEISDYEYLLTPIGRLLTKKMQDIILFKLVTTKHKNFWDQHFSKEIPEEFLATIGDLYISEIIADTNVEIFNVYFNFLKIVQEAEQLYILTPISSPAHMHAVMKRISEGAYVEILVGKDLFEQLSASPNIDQIHELATHTKSKIFVLDKPPRLGLTVTDKHISLGLFKNDGIYDTTTDLFSVDEKAVNWGRRVYQHYRADAIEMTL